MVLRIDTASSGEAYETIGPRTEGYATFEEADAEARSLSHRYPQGSFAVFQRRALYSASIGTTRRLDRNPAQPKSNVTAFKPPEKSLRVTK